MNWARRRQSWLRPVIGVVIGLLLIAVCGSVLSATLLFVAAGILVSILYSQSVSFSIGFGGVATFGNQAFFGLGGYLAAWLSINEGFGNVGLLILIGIVAGVLGSSLTVFLVRGQTGFVFGMLTLAIGQTVYEFVSGTSVAGGSGGYAGVPRGSLLGLDLNDAGTFYWFMAVIVIIVTLLLYGVRQSAFGQVLSATRQSALRAETLGAPVNRYKGLAVMMSGGLAGLAGALYAITYGAVDPSMFYWVGGAAPILAGILGGMRTLTGPIVGATIYGGVIYAFSLSAAAGQLYVSLIVLAIFLLMPDGVVPALASGARYLSARFGAVVVRSPGRPGEKKP
jgi:branched-chain amino acid transport system permease protein